ncbi:MAG: hypothetical protein U0T81_14420 [Saprospiraceae bacterium]
MAIVNDDLPVSSGISRLSTIINVLMSMSREHLPLSSISGK